MKRPPILPDLSAPSRGRRHLSEEERTLWESVARQVKPLKRRPRVLKPSAAPPLAPIGRRERARLSKGRSEIDARLDLHGMTQTRAHRVLLSFLQRAHHDGLTFVL